MNFSMIWILISLFFAAPDDKPLILERVELDEIPFVRADGATWDEDASGPDVFFILTNLATGEIVYESSIQYNLKPDLLPRYWHITQERIPMTNNKWEITLLDEDDGEQEVMTSWEFDVEFGEDDMDLKNDPDFEMELQFDEVDL